MEGSKDLGLPYIPKQPHKE